MGLFNRKKIQPNDKIEETNELTDEELEQIVSKHYQYTEEEKLENSLKMRNYLTNEDWTYINTKARDENHRKLLINELAQLRYNEYIASLENQKGKSR